MTEQNKELFKEFVNFCDSQPKGKEIDHEYWNTCAVGEFARTKGLRVPKGFIEQGSKGKFVSFIEGLVGLEYDSIEDSRLGYAIVGNKPHNTYGEFTQFLKQYL